MSVELPDPRALFPGGVALPAPATPVAASAPPTVAVLCDPAHATLAASAAALALAAAAGTRCAVAMAVGRGERAAMPLAATAGRGAARLRGRGYDATAVGRLVCLADLRVSRRPQAVAGGAAGCGPIDDDPVGAVAAASLELAGAARAIGAPAAVAIPLARTAALDRVLGWHDGIVVVDDERTTMPELAELARASLSTLDRPLAAMALPSRLTGRAALAGLRATDAAVRAIAELGLLPGRG